MNGWRTLFPNALYIAAREYRGRVGGRSFLIGTALLAVLTFLATQVPVIVDYFQGTSETKIAVVMKPADAPANAILVLDTALNPAAIKDPSAHKEFILTAFGAADEAAATAALEKGEFSGLLLVDRDPATSSLRFTLRADMAADGRTATLIQNAATALRNQDVLTRAGISPAQLAPLQQDVQFAVVSPKPGSDGKPSTPTDTSSEIANSILSTGLIVLIFMAIITYGTWVAMSVAEEKGSRVMELMLNATTPLQMLAGKVLGNGAAGLTQYGAIVVCGIAGILAQGSIRQAVLGSSSDGTPFSGLSAGMFGAFIVLFVLGLLLYSLLYAALGSLVSRQEDVQSATSPLMMLIMAGYFLSVFSISAINEAWVVALSYVPFFSPYLMLARVATGHVELWEFGLTIVLMLAAAAVALVIAARVYSAGVLLYGQRVGLRQVLRAARVSR